MEDESKPPDLEIKLGQGGKKKLRGLEQENYTHVVHVGSLANLKAPEQRHVKNNCVLAEFAKAPTKSRVTGNDLQIWSLSNLKAPLSNAR